jgi:hypothetical protein
VLIASRWILAALRNRTFYSLEEMRAAVAELLERLNGRKMRRLGKSRRELFEEIECRHRSQLRDGRAACLLSLKPPGICGTGSTPTEPGAPAPRTDHVAGFKGQTWA